MSLRVRLSWKTALFATCSFLPVLDVAAQNGLRVRNLKMQGEPVLLSERWLILSVDESLHAGRDLNGDGDMEDRVPHVHDLETGETRSMALAGAADERPMGPLRLAANWFVFAVSEAGQGKDLNGDGDIDDQVPHVYNLDTAATRNLGLASAGDVPWQLSGRWFVFAVSETGQVQDLNGNGRIDSVWKPVVHAHNLETGQTMNLKRTHYDDWSVSGWFLQLWEDWVAFRVEESIQLQDLNGDGDSDDIVMQVQNLETLQTVVGDESEFLWLSGSNRSLFNGNELVFTVSERLRAVDLNGDGDNTDEVFHALDLHTGRVQNLELASGIDSGSSCRIRTVSHSGTQIALGAWEPGQGEDLNGDGDLEDYVLHVYNPDTHETTNLRVAVDSLGLFRGNWLAFTVSERCRGLDLNHDGDTDDRVPYVHNLQNGRTEDFDISVSRLGLLSGHWLALWVSEEDEGDDLNRDGDIKDGVLHVHNLESGDTENLELAATSIHGFFGKYLVFSVDDVLYVHDVEDNDTQELGAVRRFRLSEEWLVWETADAVVQLLDFTTGETVDLGLVGRIGVLSGRRLAMTVSEGAQEQDLNGDGDQEDWVVHLVSVPLQFVRGDCNGDGGVNLSDASCTLNWLFAGAATPGCIAALDTNGDGDVNIADSVFLLEFLFAGGPPLSAPYPHCGPGTLPADEALGCANPPDCQ